MQITQSLARARTRTVTVRWAAWNPFLHTNMPEITAALTGGAARAPDDEFVYRMPLTSMQDPAAAKTAGGVIAFRWAMGTKVCLLWPVLSCLVWAMGTKVSLPWLVWSCVGHGNEGLFVLPCLVWSCIVWARGTKVCLFALTCLVLAIGNKVCLLWPVLSGLVWATGTKVCLPSPVLSCLDWPALTWPFHFQWFPCSRMSSWRCPKQRCRRLPTSQAPCCRCAAVTAVMGSCWMLAPPVLEICVNHPAANHPGWWTRLLPFLYPTDDSKGFHAEF